MNKDEILRRLQSIINEITCMNLEHFERHINKNNFEIKFDDYYYMKKSKIKTFIRMDKVEFNDE